MAIGLSVPLTTAPMEAQAIDALPAGSGWQFEPKWDGFRCLAFRDGADVELKAKSGKSLSRFFPEVVARLRTLTASRFILDGELAIAHGGRASFDALQMRLHPATSRISRLAAETPATFIVFDLLAAPDAPNLMDAPLSERREKLEGLVAQFDASSGVRLTRMTQDRRVAANWLKRAGDAYDGVVAKRRDRAYEAGARAMLKVKRLRTADCVVGGFRYETNGDEVGSLLLGLYNADGALDHVGFTSGFAQLDRRALTQRLKSLVASPGFTGKAPGGPSRWSTERSAAWQPLRPELIAEVRFDHVTEDRFRHGTKFLRWRPDKAPRQCTFAQIAPPGRPPRAIAETLR